MSNTTTTTDRRLAVSSEEDHAAAPSNLGWRIFKNSAAQVASRLCIAALRLIVAGMILRAYGKDVFGEYALIFGLLSIADWLLDFGTTEVFVREMCRARARTERLLHILTAVKIVQIPAALAVLAALTLALGYPGHIFEAVLVGGLNLLFYGGVLVYRALFKATLTLEREAVAELLSVLAVIPLLALACHKGAGLSALIGGHVASRAIFFGLCYLFGKARYRPTVQGVARADLIWALRACAAIGIIGFLVGGYETIDILLLSKLSGFAEVAYYSGAQRLVWPVLMALMAVAGSFYPVIASFWPQDQAQFTQAYQRGLDTIVALAGLPLSVIWAGAGFFMGLLGEELAAGAAALRILTLLCFVKAITSMLGPVLYILKEEKKALQFIAVAVVIKALVMGLVAPRFGYRGVALGALAIELCCATVPTVYLVQRLSNYRLRWGVTLKVAGVMMAAAWLPSLVLPSASFASAVAAGLLYLPLAFGSGAVRLSEVSALLKGGAS